MQNKQTKNGRASTSPGNAMLKPALSSISGRIFNWYLWSTQLALDQIPSFFHPENVTRFHLSDSFKIRSYHVI